jgi:hypothetical protein
VTSVPSFSRTTESVHDNGQPVSAANGGGSSLTFYGKMKKLLHIRTYDSIPTDLAGEMRSWREFVSGESHTVHLRDERNGEEVSVCMCDTSDDLPTVIVEGSFQGPLLDRVLGRTIQALSEHSDNLMVCDMTIAEPTAAPNGVPSTPFGNSGGTEGPPSVS